MKPTAPREWAEFWMEVSKSCWGLAASLWLFMLFLFMIVGLMVLVALLIIVVKSLV